MIRLGDLVRVRNDLVADEMYDGLYFNCEMVGFRGKVMMVDEIYDEDRYLLKGGHGWFFNMRMLEVVTQFGDDFAEAPVKKARLLCDIFGVGNRGDIINVVVIDGYKYLNNEYLPMYGTLSATEAEIIEKEV